MTPLEGTRELAEMLGLAVDEFGWWTEQDGNLSPLDTSRPGIFLAGCGIGQRHSRAVSQGQRGGRQGAVAAGPLGWPLMKRIGIFVCHCGNNIAGNVDVPRDRSKRLPNSRKWSMP